MLVKRHPLMFVLVVLHALLVLLAFAQRNGKLLSPQAKVEWLADLNEAQLQASKSKKTLLAVFR